MCQEANVVAIAKIPKGGLNGEFWYLDENKKIQKSPPIVFTHHNLNGKDGYTGKLELTDEIKQALSGAKIQKLDDSFSGRDSNIMRINPRNKFSYFSSPGSF